MNDELLMNKLLSIHSSIIKIATYMVEKKETEKEEGYIGLTRVQFNLLYIIKTLGKTTISTIVKATDTSKSSISITLTKLEKEGLIKRIEPEKNEDKRLVYVSLTKLGEEKLDIAEKAFKAKFLNFYNDLDKSKKQSLNKLIDDTYNFFEAYKEEIYKWS